MSKFEALAGNEAVATAMRQINPDVMAAYPITPQTSTVQKFADFVAEWYRLGGDDVTEYANSVLN